MDRQSDDELPKSESLCKDIVGDVDNTAIEDIGSQVDSNIDVDEEIIHECIDETTSADEEILPDSDGTSSINKEAPKEIIQEDPNEIISANGGRISEDSVEITSEDNMEIMSEDNMEIMSEDNIEIMSEDNIEIMSEDNIEIMSEDNIEIMSEDNIEIMSEDNIEIMSEDEPHEMKSFDNWPKEYQRRFVREIIESAEIIRNAFNGKRYYFPFSKIEVQSCFSVPIVWKRKMWKYIFSQRHKFNSLIQRTLEESSNPDIFEGCLDAFKDKYQPEEYSYTRAIHFSTAIAFLGIHLRVEGLDPDACIKAEDYIYSLTTAHSSEQDTLSESSG